MWRLLYDSVSGTSHSQRGQICQDSSFARGFSANGEEFLLLACADGAGTAIASEVGSKLACDAFIHYAINFLQAGGQLHLIERALLLEWVWQVRSALEAEAEVRNIGPSELACTLLFAAVGAQGAAYLQIGDGALVVSDADGYRPVFWPETGEYHNTTYFVTDSHVSDHVQTEVTSHAPDEIAAFTDGLQMLALNYSKKNAHVPFFRPLFRVMRNTPDCAELTISLRQFLDGESVNARTDDDKSLILAVRVPANGDESV